VVGGSESLGLSLSSMHLSMKKARGAAGASKDGALFATIDESFLLSKTQLETPHGVDSTHMYNGKPTDFTNLQNENLQLDPHRAATLRRSNFLPYDGVLYEINDAPTETEALWSQPRSLSLPFHAAAKAVRHGAVAAPH
jgi:hypothetical protein